MDGDVLESIEHPLKRPDYMWFPEQITVLV